MGDVIDPPLTAPHIFHSNDQETLNEFIKFSERPSPFKKPEVNPLTGTDVEARQEVYGLNEFHSDKGTSCFIVLCRSFVHPFNVLLFIIAGVSGLLEEYATMAIMIFMSVLSAGLRFSQELKSNRAATSLESFITYNVQVYRNLPDENDEAEIVESTVLSNELVPGDIIRLNPGDSIPADCEILSSSGLHVSQAFLTGEPIPVEKYPKEENQTIDDDLSFYSEQDLSENSNDTSTSITINEDEEEENNSSEPICQIEWCLCCTRCCSCLDRFFRNVFGVRAGAEPTKYEPETINLDQPDICFMGTSVITGSAVARVLFTGANTYFGRMAKEISKRRPVNAFQLGVRRISWIFFMTMTCLVPPVLFLQGYVVQKGRNWLRAFNFSLSVAVGLTPEMLPMIVNTTLAKGSAELSKMKCIVKNQDAIINLGGMDILCTDKTGTLTQSVVFLIAHCDQSGRSSRFPLILAYLNTFFQSACSNPLDEAIAKFTKNGSYKMISPKEERELNEKCDGMFGEVFTHLIVDLPKNFKCVKERPFDFERKRVSVLLERIEIDERSRKNKERRTGEYICICKGGVEEIIAVCDRMYKFPSGHYKHYNPDIDYKGRFFDGSESIIVPLTINEELQLQEIHREMNREGLRVISVAIKLFKSSSDTNEIEESGLIFVGFLGFLDPPKDSAEGAIERLLENNIEIKVLTGDSSAVCNKICEVIGLPVQKIVKSRDLMGASEAEITRLAIEGTIFSKLTPLQKSDIIRALKRNGNIVGYMGDGINDAAALAEADVGISVDTGSDIAKDCADIILLDKDLEVVVDGIVIGRKTYGNTLKYIVMAVSSNFGNVFSMMVASCWLPFEPMRPVQIIVQNLLYDISQIAIPWDNVDPEFLAVPHRWSMKSVLLFMVMVGPWSSLFDVLTFVYMYYYYGIQTDDPEKVKLFQTTWFTVGLLTQTMIVHMIRTPKIPFIQSRASLPVILMTLFIGGIGLSLPYIPYVNVWLNMTPLDSMVYPFLGGTIITYCCVAQLAKTIFIKCFNKWY